MIGGVVTLVVIGAGASVIATKYDYSGIITETCKKIMQKDNLSKDQMCEKIDRYLLTKGLKEKVKAAITNS